MRLGLLSRAAILQIQFNGITQPRLLSFVSTFNLGERSVKQLALLQPLEVNVVERLDKAFSLLGGAKVTRLTVNPNKFEVHTKSSACSNAVIRRSP